MSRDDSEEQELEAAAERMGIVAQRLGISVDKLAVQIVNREVDYWKTLGKEGITDEQAYAAGLVRLPDPGQPDQVRGGITDDQARAAGLARLDDTFAPKLAMQPRRARPEL